MKYIVVEAWEAMSHEKALAALQAEVNERLAEGYTLAGGIASSIDRDASGATFFGFYQAMVKHGLAVVHSLPAGAVEKV